MRCLWLVLIASWLGLVLLSGCARDEPNPWDLVENRPGNTRWVDDCLVITGLGGMPKAEADIPRFVRDLEPDFNDWTPGYALEPLARLGILSSRSSAQYQEVDPDFDAAPMEAVAGRRLDGQMTALTIPWGQRVSTCHNRPAWRSYFRTRLLETVPEGGAINQDNIASVWRASGGFCVDCVAGFRDWLRERYDTRELRAMGVSDLATFDFREYAVERLETQSRQEFVATPLVFEYIVYQHASQRDRWREHADACRELEEQLGRSVPVGGNQVTMVAQRVFGNGIIHSTANDYISIEADPALRLYSKPDGPRMEMTYKVARASGDFAKPVWTRGGLYDFQRRTPEGKQYRARLLLRRFLHLALSEAFANGGVRVLNIGGEGAPAPEPPFRFTEEFHKAFTDYTAFLNANRAVFQDTESLARVAVVYSVPVQALRTYPALHTPNESHEWVTRIARVLQATHVPFDVLLFGHPDLFDDARQLERMGRYSLIVLPSIEILSNVQSQAVRRYVERGGRVLMTGAFGTRDERYRPTHPPPGPSRGRERVFRCDLTEGAPEQHDEEIRRAVSEAVSSGGRLVRTNAPALTVVNVRKAQRKQRIAVHLLNYDIDIMADTGTPARNVEVSLALPKGFPQRPEAIVLSPEQGTKRLPIRYREGRAEVTLPLVDVYSVVVFGDEAEMEAASELSRLRRELRRLQVLGALAEGDEAAYLAAHEAWADGRYGEAFEQADELRKSCLERISRAVAEAEEEQPDPAAATERSPAP